MEEREVNATKKLDVDLRIKNTSVRSKKYVLLYFFTTLQMAQLVYEQRVQLQEFI